MPEFSLDRLEKASGLVRNLVIVFGALIPAAFFIHKELRERIQVDFIQIPIHGSRTAVIERDELKTLLNQGKTDGNLPISLGSTFLTQYIGRLDAIVKVDIYNHSKVTTDLRLILRNPRAFDAELPSSTDQHWDPLSRRQFLIVDPQTSCSIDDALLKFNKGDNVLTADEIGVLHVRDFPAECMISVQIAFSRSNEVPIEVYANGTRYYPKEAKIVNGRLGHYAYMIQERGFLGYLLLIILPIITIALVCLYSVKLITRFHGPASATPISGKQ